MFKYLSFFCAFLLCAMAQNHELHFKTPHESKMISSSVQGYETRTYLFKAKAKQKISIEFHSKHGASYFNFLPSSAITALYRSDISGQSMQMYIPQSGYYTLQVYLMRSAARRNEKAHFTLNITLEDDVNAPMQTRYPLPPLYYDAYALIPCSLQSEAYEMMCEGIVIREHETHRAHFWIKTPLQETYSEEYAFSYQDGIFFQGEKNPIHHTRIEDTNHLNVHKKLFFKIPDAFVLGG